jgi:hypothetical protein
MDQQTSSRIETHGSTPQEAGTGVADGWTPHGFWDRAADFLLSIPAGICVRLGG